MPSATENSLQGESKLTTYQAVDEEVNGRVESHQDVARISQEAPCLLQIP